MMKRSLKSGLLVLASASLFLAGCTTTTYPVAGMWTQDVRVSVDGNKKPANAKEGRACATSYVGVFAFGDASVEAAAANGGISRVQAVEALVNARIVMGTYCTIVYGS
jgi:hypothetical protein